MLKWINASQSGMPPKSGKYFWKAKLGMGGYSEFEPDESKWSEIEQSVRYLGLFVYEGWVLPNDIAVNHFIEYLEWLDEHSIVLRPLINQKV